MLGTKKTFPSKKKTSIKILAKKYQYFSERVYRFSMNTKLNDFSIINNFFNLGQ